MNQANQERRNTSLITIDHANAHLETLREKSYGSSKRIFIFCSIVLVLVILSLKTVNHKVQSDDSDNGSKLQVDKISTQIEVPPSPGEIESAIRHLEKLRSENSAPLTTFGNLHELDYVKQYDAKSQELADEIRKETTELQIQLSAIQEDIQSEAKRIESLLRRSKLEVDFIADEAEVRAYLGALIAHGLTQPMKGGEHKPSFPVTAPGPVSLKALIECGALKPTEFGLSQLGRVGSHESNDRGRHSFPPRIGGSLERYQFEFLLPAQNYLIKYQELLVDKGYLAP